MAIWQLFLAILSLNHKHAYLYVIQISNRPSTFNESAWRDSQLEVSCDCEQTCNWASRPKLMENVGNQHGGGSVRAFQGNANLWLIKFETDCVMIDLPSLAMQNIMLPKHYASWAYCLLPLCWQTEKNVQGTGTEHVTRKQRVSRTVDAAFRGLISSI